MPREPKPAKNDVSENDKNEPREQRSYYYDDAHGYQDFDPECDAEIEEAEEAIS